LVVGLGYKAVFKGAGGKKAVKMANFRFFVDFSVFLQTKIDNSV
jgi:hypothetical protein